VLASVVDELEAGDIDAWRSIARGVKDRREREGFVSFARWISVPGAMEAVSAVQHIAVRQTDEAKMQIRSGVKQAIHLPAELLKRVVSGDAASNQQRTGGLDFQRL
jgi:hypothetical protein